MNYLKLQNEKLDVGDINLLVSDESCGAISMFIGITRDNFEDKKVVSLEYEAYEPMAIKTMNKLCDDLRLKWPDLKHIAIYHRLGIVPVKEASVIIAISSPHRLSSLEAVQYAIDELKRTVPIWKKEKYENNTRKLGVNCIKKRLKLETLNFEDCEIDSTSTITLPKGFVQINANEDELSRRIQCFIERKREEIDLNNVLDFTKVTDNSNLLNDNNKSVNDDNDDGETCARVRSIIIQDNNLKRHVKVRRVKNEYGPQTIIDYTNALDKLTTGSSSHENQNQNNKSDTLNNNSNIDIKALPIGITDRLEKVENFLNVPQPISKDIYQRLKNIENKIKFLESVSPEYRHFVDSRSPSKEDVIQKKKYTIQDLDNYIAIFNNKK